MLADILKYMDTCDNCKITFFYNEDDFKEEDGWGYVICPGCTNEIEIYQDVD